MRRRLALAASAAPLVLMAACCCPQGPAEGLLLAEARVDPVELPFSGGTIRITATLADGVGESVTVTASVLFPDEDAETLGLHPSSGDPSALEAVLDIPANSDGAGAAETYRVLLAAETASGGLRQDLDLGIVTVAGAIDPPSPPLD